MHGDFSYDDYNAAQWTLFVLSSIFMPLVMLNLLIAIMSDTFERVNNSMVEADGKELNSMILEQENMLFWNRSANERTHLHWAHYTDSSDGEAW
jgi:hypothetical protein